MGINVTMNAVLLSIGKRQSRLEEVDAERDQLVKELESLLLSVSVIEQDYDIDLSATDSPAYPYSDLHNVDDADIPITHKARNAAYAVLVETRPMHRERILEEIEAMGVEIMGRDPAGLLSSYLSPDERFMSVQGLRGYWTLTEEPSGRVPITPIGEGE